MEDVSFIIWKAEYSVGHDKLDEQHSAIINIINRLYRNMQSGVESDDLQKMLHELLQYANTHLIDEEEIMKGVNYPDLKSHQKVHKSYIANVDNILQRFNTSDPDAAFETLKFLRNWWINHILSMDKLYKSYLIPE
jgi:hemerythrin